MTTELRPRSLGEILDGTAQLYRSHFALFAGIGAFPAAVPVLFGLVAALGSRFFRNGGSHPAAIVGAAIGIVVGGLAYVALVSTSLAATSRAVSDLYLDKPASIASAYRQVKPHWFRYIWVMFVAAVYAWVPVMLLFSLIFGAALVPGIRNFPGGVVFLPITLIVLAVPLGVWMMMRYSLSVPSSIFEELRVHASLKRSVFLSKGSRGKIFVMLLLVGIISSILTYAVQLPLLMAGAALGQTRPVIALILLVAGEVGGFAVTTLLSPVYGIATTLLYYDARIRKEGFDIEWMMARANLTPPTSGVQIEGSPLEAGIS